MFRNDDHFRGVVVIHVNQDNDNEKQQKQCHVLNAENAGDTLFAHFGYILLAQITLLENASRILYFLVLVDEFPQILTWLFKSKCSGKHIPYHKIHPD
jgi:hypothetical protein